MKRKTLNEKQLTMMINNETYLAYVNKLRMLATSLFSWRGLDEICGFGATRFLENALFENGRACFIKDKELGYLIMNANPNGKLNNYNIPTKVIAYSFNYNKTYDLDDIVYIMNNDQEIPTFQIVNNYAWRLYETERCIDINLNAQKTPVLIEGDSRTILTLKQFYEQYSGNIPFIFGNQNFDISNKLSVLKTDAPYLIDKLDLHKTRILNECLTNLGINNANTDKKERLITDEVESNDDLVRYFLKCYYNTRKEACDMINKKFFNGEEKIKIELNPDLISLIHEEKFIENEGDENGKIYNND